MADHMKLPRRPVRKNLPLIAVAAAVILVTWWTVGQLGDLGSELRDTRAELHQAQGELREARTGNQVLSDQVRKLGGVPAVTTPPPSPVPGSDGRNGRDGRDGRPGTDGKDGAPGEDGQNGAPGTPGSPGPATTGAPGATGPKGEPGEQGPTGPPGPSCPDGWHQETVTVVTARGPRETVTCVTN